LTTHAIEDAAMAWRVVGWYRQRWTIEQFFRTLKQQGLQLEACPRVPTRGTASWTAPNG